jgi:hypothetical protein
LGEYATHASGRKTNIATQASLVAAVDKALNEMTLKKDPELWNASALATRAEWENVRRQAQVALRELGRHPKT